MVPAPEALRLLNPIASDLDQLRPTPVATLALAAARNAARGYPDVALFEVGPAFAEVGQEAVAAGLRAGHTPRHPLADSYHSQAALRYGDHVAKLGVFPASRELNALGDGPLDLNGDPDGFRAAVVGFFRRASAEFDLRVQLCTDLQRMPVEDASVEWDEERSPYRTVGRITVEPQMSLGTDLAGVVDEARRTGFTETILGRRRHLPDLLSDNRQRREMAERMALNAPIQGSAADLIKVAMLRLAGALGESSMSSRMLLQVHDELVLEVPEAELDWARAEIPRLMAGVAALKVPLLAEVGVGANWDEAH